MRYFIFATSSAACSLNNNLSLSTYKISICVMNINFSLNRKKSFEIGWVQYYGIELKVIVSKFVTSSISQKRSCLLNWQLSMSTYIICITVRQINFWLYIENSFKIGYVHYHCIELKNFNLLTSYYLFLHSTDVQIYSYNLDYSDEY